MGDEGNDGTFVIENHPSGFGTIIDVATGREYAVGEGELVVHR